MMPSSALGVGRFPILRTLSCPSLRGPSVHVVLKGGIPMATKYDAIVIGTGQAGPSLAVRLAETGMKVAIIERKRFGGTCVNNGCIPTKTLIASARTAHVARRAGDYGVTIPGSIAVDMKKVKVRKDAL